MRLSNRVIVISALSLASGLEPALGQDTPATEASPDSNILELPAYQVTSTQISRSLFDTQESIALLPQPVLETRGLEDLQEVLPQTANVYSLAGEGFGIRGIAHNSASTFGGQGESGSYYFDGVALTSFAKRFGPEALWDIQQVEILRGPQSTNVGRNAIAGAIVLKSNDPVFNRESAFRIRGGSYDTVTLSGMTNVPLNGQSALRFVGDYHETRGYITNPTRNEDDYDAREESLLRAKYLWNSGDGKVSVRLTAQHADTARGEDFIVFSYIDEQGNPVSPDIAKRQNLANLDAFENNEAWLLSADIEVQLSDTWSFNSRTSLLASDYERRDDDDQLPRGGNAFRGRTAEDDNWAEELRLRYAGGGRLAGVVGVFYTEVDLINHTDALINIAPSQVGVPAQLLSFYPQLLSIEAPSVLDKTTTNAAVFTEWEFDLTERWTLFAGARYDYEELDTDTEGSRTLVNTLPDPTMPGLPPQVAAGLTQVNAAVNSMLVSSQEASSTSYDAFLPQAGVNYDLKENLSVGFLVKQGYRAGGVEVNSVGVRTEYEPEFLTNYEFNLRSRWMDGRLGINFNAYFGEWTDQQIGVRVMENNTVDTRTLNAGESELYGFELEATGRPVTWLAWFANVGYSHTEFLEFDSAEGDFSGNRFGFAPEWTGSAGATINPVEDGLFLHANATYQGDSYTNPANTFQLDAHTIANLRLGYRHNGTEITLFVDNAFDELYLVNKTSNFDPTTTLAKVGDPRLIGVEVRLRF